jgi:cell division protein ZapA (FtsZ GTPase activity inhibitor)
MNKNQLRIDLLGTSFSIQSEEKQEYLKAVYDYLKVKINEIKEKGTISDPLKIALLASLNIIDDLFREKEKLYRLRNSLQTDNKLVPSREIVQDAANEIDEIAARIMKKIDESLIVE